MTTTLDVTDMLPKKWEPIQKRRFLGQIEGIDSFFIKTVALPQIQTEEVAINWMNVTRYVAGKTTFGTMAVTLHSGIAPSIAQQIMLWSRSCHDQISGRNGFADFYKRDMRILITDPVGNVVQRWDFKGAFITEANFGDMSYESTNEVAEISLTIRYDSMVLVH